MHLTWCTLLKFFIPFIRCDSIHIIVQWNFRTCDHIFTAHSQTHPTWFILFVHVIDENTFSHCLKFPRYDIFVPSIRHYTWKLFFFCQHHILQALHRIQQFMGKFNQNWTKKEAYTIPKNSFVWKPVMRMFRVSLWKGHKAIGKKETTKRKATLKTKCTQSNNVYL